MALQSGNYIVDTDVDNWPAGATDAYKLEVIQRIEAQVERLTRDIFYERSFDIFRDGNGKDYLPLGLRAKILSISAIYLLGVAMNTSTYTWNSNVVHRDDSGIDTDDYLRWLKHTKTRTHEGFFPKGEGNLEIVGTMGWPQKLSFDNLSGTFRTGEIITGATNSYTATVIRVHDDFLHIAGKTGQFADDEGLTGGTSGATADVNSTNGAIDDPPLGIKKACVMLASYDNDSTLYEKYVEGTERIGDMTYTNRQKILTGVREIDDILRRFVRKTPKVRTL